MIKLKDQNKTGLFPEHKNIESPAYHVIATVPVVEQLQLNGNAVLPKQYESSYTVVLSGRVPSDVLAVHLNREPGLGLRLTCEPEYPLEFDDYWAQLDFTPCPKCGAALVWYEAGYVPGYRVCTKAPHHHFLAK